MGFFGRIKHGKLTLKTSLAGMAVLALVGTASGVSWALAAPTPPPVEKVKASIQYAATYQVTAELGTGDQVVHWPSVGQVDMISMCRAETGDNGRPGMGTAPLAFNNNGPGPVGITFVRGAGSVVGPDGPMEGTPSGGFFWVDANPQPAESFWINGPGQQWSEEQGEDAAGGIITFGIVNEHGPSVTGTLAYSYRFAYTDYTAGTGSGHCVFTLQMKG